MPLGPVPVLAKRVVATPAEVILLVLLETLFAV